MHIHYFCEPKADSPTGCREYHSLPLFSPFSNVQAPLLSQPLSPPSVQPLKLKCEPHEDRLESKSLRQA